MNKKDAVLHMRLPSDFKVALERSAKMDDRSVASLVTKLIRDHCEKVGVIEPALRR